MRYLLYQCPSYYNSFLYWPSSFDTQKSFKGSYFPMLETSFTDKRGGWIPLTCSIMYLFETVIFTSIEIMLKVITAMNSLSHLMEFFYIYFIQLCFNHFLISDLCMHAQVSQHMFWEKHPRKSSWCRWKRGQKGWGRLILCGHCKKWPVISCILII